MAFREWRSRHRPTGRIQTRFHEHGVFAPAYGEYLRRWLTPWRRLSPRELANRLLPAQVYRPTRPAADFAAMAAAFHASSIPIVFNAYDISKGQELLFGNPAALKFLKADEAVPHLVAGRDAPSRYRPIDAAAVESALWLTLYGFDHRYEGAVVIDGAYHRQLIIAELTSCTVIYAVKPQNDAWRADPPANYFEVQDFNTEMWFNSSFAAEVAALESAAAPAAARADHDGPPAGLLELLRREDQELRRGVRGGQETAGGGRRAVSRGAVARHPATVCTAEPTAGPALRTAG